jgi:hypothetical protein
MNRALEIGFRHCERSEAIQSESPTLDCFVAKLVIGPVTSGRTRWLLAMTEGYRSSGSRMKDRF